MMRGLAIRASSAGLILGGCETLGDAQPRLTGTIVVHFKGSDLVAGAVALVDTRSASRRDLAPQQVWAIRFWLDREQRVRDRAMFDLAVDI